MNLMQSVKNGTQAVTDNPIKIAASIITIAITMFGATFFLDDRYALATDVQALKETQQKIVDHEQKAIDNLRREQLEDKVFELQLKPKLTQSDKALLGHYQQQLQDIKDKGAK